MRAGRAGLRRICGSTSRPMPARSGFGCSPDWRPISASWSPAPIQPGYGIRRRRLRRGATGPADAVHGSDVVLTQHRQHLPTSSRPRPGSGVRKIVFASSETTVRDLLRPGRAAPADYVPVDEDHPTVPGGRLRDVEGRRRGDGALLPGPHGQRTSTACGSTTSSSRSEYAERVPVVPRRPVAAAAQHLRLHRRPRSGPDRRSAAWRPTAWATRSSTSPTPTCPSRRRRRRSCDRFYDGVEVRRDAGP